MTLEEKIFKKKFKNEEFNPDDYNDWANENPSDAYRLCLRTAEEEIQRWRLKYNAIAVGYELKIKEINDIEYMANTSFDDSDCSSRKKIHISAFKAGANWMRDKIDTNK